MLQFPTRNYYPSNLNSVPSFCILMYVCARPEPNALNLAPPRKQNQSTTGILPPATCGEVQFICGDAWLIKRPGGNGKEYPPLPPSKLPQGRDYYWDSINEMWRHGESHRQTCQESISAQTIKEVSFQIWSSSVSSL